MQRLYAFLILVSLFLTAPLVSAAEAIVDETHGVSFYQLDYPELEPPILDSATGVLGVNLLTLRDTTGIESGYLNVVMEGEWVVQNLLVPSENDFPYAAVTTRFDLMVPEGTDVPEINATVSYADEFQLDTPSASAAPFVVLGQDLDEGGVVIGDGETENEAEVAKPPAPGALLAKNVPANISRVIQKGHPNTQAAKNQCAPMSVANSLQFLVNTTDLELPHSHVPGLKGDNSLVGQLDTHMRRNVESRTKGDGVSPIAAVMGKLSYVAANGLQDRIQTRHWGRSVFKPKNKAVGELNMRWKDRNNNNVATSQRQGATFDIDDITSAMGRGENCEAFYTWPGGPDRRNGHAVDLVASGSVTQGEGEQQVKRPFVFLASDLRQGNDRAGTRTLEFAYLSDPDMDGYYNLAGGKELDHLICQKYIPETTEQASLLPDPGTEYAINSLDVIEKGRTDIGGHFGFTQKLPTLISMLILLLVILSFTTALTGDAIEIGANDVNEPFEEVQFIEGEEEELPGYLMFDDISIDSEGNLEGENSATVAGFSNVSSTISGQILPTHIEATLTIGANEELPGGEPLIYELEFVPDAPWPWTLVPVTPELSPAITVNGMRGEHTVGLGDPIALGLSMIQGDQSGPRDWWIAAQSEDLLLTFDLESGNWTGEVKPTYSGDLFDLPQTTFFQSLEGLPAGDYTFYAGVDPMNGQLDLESIVYDAINLTVEEEAQQGL